MSVSADLSRRTKIVCTIGPSSSDRETIGHLIQAGMDVVRLNFSHGTHEGHLQVVDHVRAEAKRLGRSIPILQDLQGPKIRIGQVVNGGILLHKGQHVVLTPEPIEFSDRNRIFVNYPTLSEDVDVGGRILLDDGLLELRILECRNREVLTEVVVGGTLRSRKGVNLPHIRTHTSALTEKDVRDLEFGLSIDVDLMALSFVRSESDVNDLVARIRKSGKKVGVIAKIEKPEAVVDVDDILETADGIMVARGDLGIETPMERVPSIQKLIIQKCRAAARPVITATQMLESMIENPRPTRAEASDVANAVLDGSDALMLSGETAAGKHPIRVVETMAQIICQAEKFQMEHMPLPELRPLRGMGDDMVTNSISYTACQLARQVGAKAIACLTASGATARSIARHRPDVPVYAFTDDPRVVNQLSLVWGTNAFAIPFQRDTDRGVGVVHEILLEQELAKQGDLIVIVAGMPLPEKGRTNMVHVSRM